MAEMHEYRLGDPFAGHDHTRVYLPGNIVAFV